MQQKNRDQQGQGDIECTQTLKTTNQLDDSLHMMLNEARHPLVVYSFCLRLSSEFV